MIEWTLYVLCTCGTAQQCTLYICKEVSYLFIESLVAYIF